jgi:hypothetical protein
LSRNGSTGPILYDHDDDETINTLRTSQSSENTFVYLVGLCDVSLMRVLWLYPGRTRRYIHTHDDAVTGNDITTDDDIVSHLRGSWVMAARRSMILSPQDLKHLSHWCYKASKAVPLYALEALGGEEVQLLLILNLGTRWGEWSASRPGRAFPPRKGPPVPIVQEAGWAPEPVWTQRLEENSSASVGDRTPVVQSVVSQYDWATSDTSLVLKIVRN